MPFATRSKKLADVGRHHCATSISRIVARRAWSGLVVADDYRGETVKAVVSLRPGIQADPDEIREFCKDRLAAYKYPRIVEIIDELPKTVTGKVLRRELRDNA